MAVGPRPHDLEVFGEPFLRRLTLRAVRLPNPERVDEEVHVDGAVHERRVLYRVPGDRPAIRLYYDDVVWVRRRAVEVDDPLPAVRAQRPGDVRGLLSLINGLALRWIRNPGQNFE